MPGPMRTVSFKLSVQAEEALNDLVRRRGSNRSAVVRGALGAWMKNRRRSVTEAVDAFIGAVDGPPDLSTKPKHMARYGKRRG